jgi:alpha-1,3-mannosyltransferase
MKVLQITRQFHPSTGGIESAVNGLSRALQQREHEVDVVTLRRIFATGHAAPEFSVLDGLRVTRIPYWGMQRYPIAPDVLRSATDYDVLHIHGIDFFVDYLSNVRHRHMRPIVVTTHGGIFHTRWMSWLKSAYFNTITKRSLAYVDAVVGVSEHDYDLFSRIVPRRKLHLVRNGVAIEPYLAINKDIVANLLVGVGRLAPNKRVDQLIRVVAELQPIRPEIRLLWIGPDPYNSVPRLKQLAHECGIANRIDFAGQLSDASIRQHLSNAHIFVSASSYEGYGLSTLEAMASGTVAAVTNVGIHPQVIDSGRTGFLVPSDAKAMASCLASILQLKLDEIHKIGLAARQIAKQYSWNTVVNDYISIYDAVRSVQPVRTSRQPCAR